MLAIPSKYKYRSINNLINRMDYRDIIHENERKNNQLESQ